jgi:UDP-GlcNAc:undecaprenyl-phosphate/decaprenyl-phosphate GlcNAc-1-phosphate transferase
MLEKTHMPALLTTALIAFALCIAFTPLLRDTCIRFGIVDQPDKVRKLHPRAIPRVGGVAIMISYAGSFALMLLLAPPWAQISVQHSNLLFELLPAVGIIFFTGLLDDLFGLTPWQKLAGQFLAAILAVNSGVAFSIAGEHAGLFWLTIPLSLLWLVGCANAFNLIDGMDGLAAGIGLCATVTTAIVGYLQGNMGLAMATAPLAGCLLGFLLYNFNPASVFLGDSGSLTIGFMLGCFSLIWGQGSGDLLGKAAPLMAMAIPLVDVLLAIVRRLLRRIPIFQADRAHIHHMMLARGFNPRDASLILYGACGLGAALAILQSFTPTHFRALVLLVFCSLVAIGVNCLGYVELIAAQRTLAGHRLVRHMRDEIYMQDLTRSLSQAQSVEECWAVIHSTCRDLSFSSVQMSLNEQTYHAEFLASIDTHSGWKLTLGVGRQGQLTLTRSEQKDSPPILGAVLDQFQKAISKREHLLENVSPLLLKSTSLREIDRPVFSNAFSPTDSRYEADHEQLSCASSGSKP